jgi:hypothetical protein
LALGGRAELEDAIHASKFFVRRDALSFVFKRRREWISVEIFTDESGDTLTVSLASVGTRIYTDTPKPILFVRGVHPKDLVTAFVGGFKTVMAE